MDVERNVTIVAVSEERYAEDYQGVAVCNVMFAMLRQTLACTSCCVFLSLSLCMKCFILMDKRIKILSKGVRRRKIIYTRAENNEVNNSGVKMINKQNSISMTILIS